MHLFELSFWSSLGETIVDKWKSFEFFDIVSLIFSLLIASPFLLIFSFYQILFKGD